MEPIIPTYRRAALEDGFTDYELRRLCHHNALVRLRPGAYANPGLVEQLRWEDRHRLDAEATLHQQRRPAVISHISAAVLHRLPLWNPCLQLVHLTRDSTAGGNRTRRRHMHSSPLAQDEVVLVDGLPVTSVARTIADLAQAEPFEQAVVAGDGGLNLGLVTAPQLADAVARLECRPGSRAARRAIAFMDPRSESPGESRSRVLLHRLRLPIPQLQRTLIFRGEQLGRVDFYFERENVVGEFDGMHKYGRLLAPGQQAGDVVEREKLREDALRGAGAEVVRWTWRDLEHPGVVHRRITDAFARSRSRPPTR